MRYACWRVVKPECRILFGIERLAKRRDVVQYPEGASVSSDYQILAVNGEVADGSHRQIELQRLPIAAVIE